MIVIYTAVQKIFYGTHIMYYQFWARYRIPNIIIIHTDHDRTNSDDRRLFVLLERKTRDTHCCSLVIINFTTALINNDNDNFVALMVDVS